MVPSTLHQYVKYVHNDDHKKILGDLHPFTFKESHYADASFPPAREISSKKSHDKEGNQKMTFLSIKASSSYKLRESSSSKAPISSQPTRGHYRPMERPKRASWRSYVKIPPPPVMYSPIHLGSDLKEDSSQKVTSNVIFAEEMPKASKDLIFPLSCMSLYPIDEVQIKISRS